MLPTGQAHQGTETVLVRMSTFVSHFLAPLILLEVQVAKCHDTANSASACAAGPNPGMQAHGGLI